MQIAVESKPINRILDDMDERRAAHQDEMGRDVGSTEADVAWPEPKDLSTELLPVPSFDLRLLPPPLQKWVADIAERSQCPADFLAVGALVICAALVARHVAIRPKQHDDWMVVPNLWGGVIAPPGFLKSPALAETLKPIQHLAHEAGTIFGQAVKEHEAESVVRKAQRDNIEQSRGTQTKKRSGAGAAT